MNSNIVHIVGSTIEIYHDARSHECRLSKSCFALIRFRIPNPSLYNVYQEATNRT